MKEFLSSRRIEFTLKNVAEDKAAREELAAKYGRMATPTLIVGEKIFLGFKQNRDEIERTIDDTFRAAN